MLNELPVGAAIAHGHEGAIARHVLELARRYRLRHSYKADRQRQSGRQQRRIFYEIATRRPGTPRLAFHPNRCTTISGDGQTSKGRKSYLVPLAAKGRFWSALPGFSVAVSADSFIGHPGNRSWPFPQPSNRAPDGVRSGLCMTLSKYLGKKGPGPILSDGCHVNLRQNRDNLFQ